MAVSKGTIKNLADLARIEIDEKEAEKLAGEIEAILGYVGQVTSVAGDLGEGVEFGAVLNVTREDSNPTESGTYSKELIAEFPDKEEGYLKVKKVL